jgi:hypothetical protein
MKRTLGILGISALKEKDLKDILGARNEDDEFVENNYDDFDEFEYNNPDSDWSASISLSASCSESC